MAAQAAGPTASPTERLLDFSQPLDVNLLDQAVEAFNTGAAPPEVQQMLVQFQQHPQAWTRVDNILTKSQSPKTKMIALNILQVVIKTKWRVLPAAQREGIKKFIVNIIIQHSKEKKNLQTLGALLNKLNITLVQILKQEWPHNWPNFIPELVNSSRQSESLCANNMNILMLLSEEIFDYSAETMTSHKAQELKSTLNREFTQIYQLCEYILDKSQDQTLLSITLKTLQRFLNWIPVGFIFETKLIETLAVKFFPVSVFQNHTLLCLAQIGGLQLTDKPAYNPKFMQMFGQVIQYTGQKLLPPQVDVAAAYRGGDHNVQTFIRYLTIFISSFLKAHLSLVENGPQPVRDVLASSLMFLLRCSQVDDSVVFQVCLEYWNILVAELFKSQRQQPMGGAVPALMLGQMKPTGNARLQLYAPVLSRLRLVIISKMAKPEEIIIVEDECGNIVRERLKDTDSVILYKSMRECLVFLTHLDTQDTQNSMLMKLSKQVDGSEWSWNNLNTLCWAIGSISGAMTENTEKSFLVRVIKDLLGMCERKRGKDNKAVIASNIMYVVGQYPRFLRMHWKFLKTVVNKLFEFMHELHPGVQEMSCETLLKIAKKCRRKFVVTQAQEMRPFIEDILENLPEIIQDLEKNQIHVFYEAVALIIESEADPEARQKLVVKLMTMPNQAWSKIVTEANRSMESLWQPNTVKTLAWVMTVNIKVAQSLKGGYVVQLGRIYLEMLHVYKLYSGFITNQIKSAPAQMRGSAIVRNMRAVKRGIINLLREYARSCPSSEYGTFLSNFLPALLEPVLDDYGRGIPDSREPEVLALFTEIIGKFGSGILPQIGRVFAATFSCTLDMIKLNFSDYPEHRLHFFKMLRAINQNAFRSLLMLNPQQFQLVMDSIVWAFKHIERNVAEEGLSTLYELLQNMQTSDVANNFYRKYFISLLQDLLGVLTDTFHKPGFRLHSQILARMFSIVETGAITVPLWEGTGTQFPNNQHFVRHFTCNLLSTAFKNLSAQQVQTFVSGLFRLNNNLPEFKTLLRDFLVQIKEFGEDNTDLYAEEAAAKKEAELAQERARVAAVPGLQYEPPRSSAGVEMIPTKDVM